MCTDKIKSHAPVCMHVWTCASDLSAALQMYRAVRMAFLFFLTCVPATILTGSLINQLGVPQGCMYYIGPLLLLFYVDDL